MLQEKQKKKWGGKFLDLPSFYCTRQENNNKKNLQKPKTYCSLSNAVLRQQAKCSLNCSKEICSKELQPPRKKKKNLGIAWNVICFLFCFLPKSQNMFDSSDKLDILDVYKCWKVCLHPNFFCFSACFPVPCVSCWLVSKSFFFILIQSGYLELKLNRVVLHFYNSMSPKSMYLKEPSKKLFSKVVCAASYRKTARWTK